MGKKRTGYFLAVELAELVARGQSDGDDASLETAKERVRRLTALEQRQIRLSLGAVERMLDRASDEWQHMHEVWFDDPRKVEAEAPEQMAAKAAA